MIDQRHKALPADGGMGCGGETGPARRRLCALVFVPFFKKRAAALARARGRNDSPGAGRGVSPGYLPARTARKGHGRRREPEKKMLLHVQAQLRFARRGGVIQI